MLWQIIRFEIRYWLRSWMLWIFLLVISALIFAAASSDHIRVGDSFLNTFRNAPYVIENFYSFMGLFTLLMTPAFVNSAAARDFSYRTHEIIFSTPLRRRDYLLGRFSGATLVAIVPMLGVSIGILLAKYMPWVDAERWGPVNWTAHLEGILVFAIPNALFIAAVLFAIAVLARNEIAPFIGGLLLLTGYGVTDTLTQNIERRNLAALLDPFAIRTFGVATRYWTVADKNTHTIGLTGLLLWNRLIWLAVGLLVFAFAYRKFSFAEKRRKARAAAPEDTTPISPRATTPSLSPLPRVAAVWPQFLASTRIQLLGVVKSTSFIVILLAALLNCIPSVAMSAREAFGGSTFPVTYWVLEMISGTLYMFIIAMITLYAGVLVWKDRDARMDEIHDALPVPEWLSYASRLAALLVLVMLVQLVAMLSGVVVQTVLGYHRYQFGLYFKEMFLRDGSLLFFMAVLAFFMHAVSPNKYIGYCAFIAFLVVNFFVWRPLNVATYLVQFGMRPTVTYSDFFGDAPFRAAWDWFTLYWLLCCGLLSIAAVLFWPRGKLPFAGRLREARLRFRGALRPAALACLVLFAATGAWIAYNTMAVNELFGPTDILRRNAGYEKAYKPFDKLPQPRARSLKYAIDIYPESRGMVMRGEMAIENPHPRPLQEIHFTLNRDYATQIDMPGAVLAKDDTRLAYRIYRFTTPMQPGETRTVRFTVERHPRGFENSASNLELVQDGTFFNNGVGPVIGYRSDRELDDANDRRKYGLKEIDQMPALERNCTADCMDTYIPGHSGWVDVDTVISTSPDQIAVAPGSLVREWRGANGRRYFEYKLDHPSLAFYSFISANYQVAREDWNGIKLEVYYLKEQPWNVPRMLNSLRKSLDYYTRNFGPYMHKEARIIEFPRVARFAQAFPGTMPYSEAIGFIANLNNPDDIDSVFYVVAHEMGHQWWAHQVIGANMEGATLLSETMAQYSAFMVMEKEYGRDMQRKFLKHEMDAYLSSRGRERLKERPLLTVEAQQGYVHYRKGSVVMYYLKEMIGEEAVNRALRSLVRQYAYAPPPYPTSWALVDALRAETPPQYQYLLQDLFEDITLFSNRTLSASAHRRPDGKYDVTIDIETRKFKADAKGNETEVPLNDWIEIGAFAKPRQGRKYGRTLYRERLHLAGARSKHTFTVDELPDKAGVDPFLLLVDRMPDDNVMTVSQ
ncbi:MAG TPA: M1 family aminopeptidase [Bryobacteraceae bacterium]|nr:M1 family aminopeptidase [Bryobacteraceae bacterium]